MKLSELAEHLGAELVGDGDVDVRGCASIQSAAPDEVAFLANPAYARFLQTTKAGAVIIDPRTQRPDGLCCLVADDPYFAFRNAVIALHGFREHPSVVDAPAESPSVSAHAVVHPDASVGTDAQVHAHVTIEAGATIGRNTVLYPGVYVGTGATIGDDCILFPNVVVYEHCRLGNRVTLHANTVIGQDGFGYATHAGQHHKIPQTGIVVIEDDVELGGGCAVERGAVGETRIGAGTKFADLISIGHGSTIGRHCLFVSLVGISGSVDVGDYVVLGGQVGVAGHLRIGNGVQVAATSSVAKDVPDGMKVGGTPAIEFQKAKKNVLAGLELYELSRRVRKLERELAAARSTD